MFRKTLLALVASLLALPALAEDAPLATYNSAKDFPSDAAYIVDVTISTSGALVAKRCPPGGVAESECKIRKAVVAQPELDAILAAAQASGLLKTPALGNQDYTIIPNGTLTGGAVWLDGTYIALPNFITDTAEQLQVGPVLTAIEDAIPQDLRDALF